MRARNGETREHPPRALTGAVEQTPRQFVFDVADEHGVAQIAGSKHIRTPVAMARADATDPALPRRIVIAARDVAAAHSRHRKVDVQAVE